MGKSRFSALDVRAMVSSVAPEIERMRLANIYDMSSKVYVLKFSTSTSGIEPPKPAGPITDGQPRSPSAPAAGNGGEMGGAKKLLLLESGSRFYLTDWKRDKQAVPSVFTLKLRKLIRTKRVAYMRQLGGDRVIDLQFGFNENAIHLIVELYARGNIVVTDHNFVVKTTWRQFRKDEALAVRVGQLYPVNEYNKPSSFIRCLLPPADVSSSDVSGDATDPISTSAASLKTLKEEMAKEVQVIKETALRLAGTPEEKKRKKNSVIELADRCSCSLAQMALQLFPATHQSMVVAVCRKLKYEYTRILYTDFAEYEKPLQQILLELLSIFQSVSLPGQLGSTVCDCPYSGTRHYCGTIASESTIASLDVRSLPRPRGYVVSSLTEEAKAAHRAATKLPRSQATGDSKPASAPASNGGTGGASIVSTASVQTQAAVSATPGAPEQTASDARAKDYLLFTPVPPHVILEGDQGGKSGVTGCSDEDLITEEYDTFYRAVDQYFTAADLTKVEKLSAVKLTELESRVAKIIKDQADRVQRLKLERDAAERQAVCVEYHVDFVARAIEMMQAVLGTNSDWSLIEKMIRDQRRQNHPIAMYISGLNLPKNSFTLLVPNVALGKDIFTSIDDLDSHDSHDSKSVPESSQEGMKSSVMEDADKRGLNEEHSEDEAAERPAPEEADVDFIPVELNIGENAFGNIRRLHAFKKSTQEQFERTEDAVKVVIKKAETAAERERRRRQVAIESRPAIQKLRKVYWFEKFHWFLSSDRYLVIAGHDAMQNEILYRRYLRKHDVYVHADAHGAATCIIRNPYGQAVPVPDLTLQEAGIMSVARSSAWKNKVLSDAFWVYAHQVSKTPQPGEYLSTGGFIIRGKRNPIRVRKLEVAIGVLFHLADEESITRHRRLGPDAWQEPLDVERRSGSELMALSHTTAATNDLHTCVPGETPPETEGAGTAQDPVPSRRTPDESASQLHDVSNAVASELSGSHGSNNSRVKFGSCEILPAREIKPRVDFEEAPPEVINVDPERSVLSEDEAQYSSDGEELTDGDEAADNARIADSSEPTQQSREQDPCKAPVPKDEVLRAGEHGEPSLPKEQSYVGDKAVDNYIGGPSGLNSNSSQSSSRRASFRRPDSADELPPPSEYSNRAAPRDLLAHRTPETNVADSTGAFAFATAGPEEPSPRLSQANQSPTAASSATSAAASGASVDPPYFISDSASDSISAPAERERRQEVPKSDSNVPAEPEEAQTSEATEGWRLVKKTARSLSHASGSGSNLSQGTADGGPLPRGFLSFEELAPTRDTLRMGARRARGPSYANRSASPGSLHDDEKSDQPGSLRDPHIADDSKSDSKGCNSSPPASDAAAASAEAGADADIEVDDEAEPKSKGRKTARAGAEGASKVKGPAPGPPRAKPLSRAVQLKLRRMKEKYADQSDDERELALKLRGSSKLKFELLKEEEFGVEKNRLLNEIKPSLIRAEAIPDRNVSANSIPLTQSYTVSNTLT